MNLKNKMGLLLIIVITIPLLTIVLSHNNYNPINYENENEDLINPNQSYVGDESEAYYISADLTQMLFYSDGPSIWIHMKGEITFNDTFSFNLPVYVYSIQGLHGTPLDPQDSITRIKCRDFTRYEVGSSSVGINAFAETCYKADNIYAFDIEIKLNEYIADPDYISVFCIINGNATTFTSTVDIEYKFNPIFLGVSEDTYENQIYVSESHLDADWVRLTENDYITTVQFAIRIYSKYNTLIYETEIKYFYPVINITLNTQFIENRYIEAINVDYIRNGLYYSDASLYNFSDEGCFTRGSYSGHNNVWVETGVESPLDLPQFDFSETNQVSFNIAGSGYSISIGTFNTTGGVSVLPSINIKWEGWIYNVTYTQSESSVETTYDNNISTSRDGFGEISVRINTTYVNVTINDRSLYFSRANDDYSSMVNFTSLVIGDSTGSYPNAISDLSIGDDMNHTSSMTLDTSLKAYDFRKNNSIRINLIPGEKRIIGIASNGIWVNVSSIKGTVYDTGHFIEDYVFGGDNINITYLIQLSQMAIFSDLLDWESALNDADYIQDETTPLLVKNLYESDNIILYLKYDGDEVGIPLLPSTDINKLIPIGDVEYRVYNIENEEYETDWIDVPENGIITIGFVESQISLPNLTVYRDTAVVSVLIIGSAAITYFTLKKFKTIPTKYIKSSKKKSNNIRKSIYD